MPPLLRCLDRHRSRGYHCPYNKASLSLVRDEKAWISGWKYPRDHECLVQSVACIYKRVVRAYCSPSAAYKAILEHHMPTARVSLARLVCKCTQRKARRGENPLDIWQESFAGSDWRSILDKRPKDLVCAPPVSTICNIR